MLADSNFYTSVEYYLHRCRRRISSNIAARGGLLGQGSVDGVVGSGIIGGVGITTGSGRTDEKTSTSTRRLRGRSLRKRSAMYSSTTGRNACRPSHRARLPPCCLWWDFRRRRAVSLPRCRHRRATAKLLPTSRCGAAATVAATALLPPAAATALPPLHCAPPPPPLTLTQPQRRRQAATNVALSRCHHHLAAAKMPPTSRFCAAATALLLPPPPPPLRLSCRRPHAVTLPPPPLPPPPLPPPPRRRWLVGCCVVVRHLILLACRHATINALIAGRFRR